MRYNPGITNSTKNNLMKGNYAMSERRAMSNNQFKKSGFEASEYVLHNEEGTFTGTLDNKKWGKNKNLISYITLDSGKKIWVSTWWETKYLGLSEMNIGTPLVLTFTKIKSGAVYLRDVIKK